MVSSSELGFKLWWIILEEVFNTSLLINHQFPMGAHDLSELYNSEFESSDVDNSEFEKSEKNIYCGF